MIPELIDSICNWVIGGDEIIIITMVSRYFQVWNKNVKKLFKNLCYILIFWKYFLWNYLRFTFLGDNFFSINVILDFDFALALKKALPSSKKFCYLQCHLY